MNWKENIHEHCQICHHRGWCCISEDGAWAICRRIDTGDGNHKIDGTGGDYWVYQLKKNDTSLETVMIAPEPQKERAEPYDLDAVYGELLKLCDLTQNHRENLI